MNRILFPVEDTNPSEKALSFACEFARSYGAEIVVLHVRPYIESMSYPYAPLPELWDEEAFQKLSERITQTAANRFTTEGLNATVRNLTGDPASEILICAGEESCGMIILATHSKNAIQRFLMGSVANKVVSHAKIPVLLVR